MTPSQIAAAQDERIRKLTNDIVEFARFTGGSVIAEDYKRAEEIARKHAEPVGEALPMVELNLDHEEARALHRIVRAMHDGECPKCHDIHASDRMVIWDRSGDTGQGEKFKRGWRCPSCGFEITNEEAAEVFRIFAPFMKRNLAVFEKWRAAHADQPSGKQPNQ